MGTIRHASKWAQEGCIKRVDKSLVSAVSYPQCRQLSHEAFPKTVKMWRVLSTTNIVGNVTQGQGVLDHQHISGAEHFWTFLLVPSVLPTAALVCPSPTQPHSPDTFCPRQPNTPSHALHGPYRVQDPPCLHSRIAAVAQLGADILLRLLQRQRDRERNHRHVRGFGMAQHSACEGFWDGTTQLNKSSVLQL